jgi:hypothetical protein
MHWFHNRGTLAKLLYAFVAVYVVIVVGSFLSVGKALAELAEVQGRIQAFEALPLSQSERDLVPELDATFTPFVAIVDDMWPHMVIGTEDEIAAGQEIGQAKLGPAVMRLGKVIDDLMTLEERQAHEGQAGAAANYEWALRTLGGVLLAGLLLVVGVGLYVGRSIAEPLRAITRAALSGGDARAPSVIASATPLVA